MKSIIKTNRVYNRILLCSLCHAWVPPWVENWWGPWPLCKKCDIKLCREYEEYMKNNP